MKRITLFLIFCLSISSVIGKTTSNVKSQDTTLSNCGDSLTVSAMIACPLKISFSPYVPGEDYVELAVYKEDSTTMVSHFTKYLTSSADTTIYLPSGKYYLAWLSGNYDLNNLVLSGNNVNVSLDSWIRMTTFLGLPFKIFNKDIVCEGQAMLYANVNYKGTGTLKYKWEPSTGLDNDTIATPTAFITGNTSYIATVTTSAGCMASSTVNLTVTALTVDAGVDKSVVCGSSTQLNGVTTNYSGTGKLRYKWTPSTGLNNDTIANPIATVGSDITFTLTVTAPSGCSATDNINVKANPLTVNAGVDKTVVCGTAIQFNGVTTNYSGSGKLRYKWTPSTGLNNDTIANPIAILSDSTVYTLTVTTPEGCTATDKITIAIIPMSKPEIGIVGVSNNKNIIAWNKPVSTGIAFYNIYRETNVSYIYEKIGSVPYDSMSVFVDNQSAPDIKSNKYKLSILDVSGQESPLSDAHKTMHLSINKGQNNAWNLIWEAYEGFTVATYNIYRGTSAANLNFLDATSGSSTQYSDFSAPTGDVYYQLEVISPTLISPRKVSAFIQKSKNSENNTTSTLVSYNSSRSNVASNLVNGINQVEGGNYKINIYPNPVNDKLNIEFVEGSTFEILNLMGEIIYHGNLHESTFVDTSTFSSGIYLIKFKTDKTFEYKKIIKE